MTAAKYWDKNKRQWVIVPQGISRATADGLYLNTVGDFMTGPLLLADDPLDPMEASTKQYVDAAVLIPIAAHEAKANPHPIYATDADLAAHTSATDPHPIYLTKLEGDSFYSLISHVHASVIDYWWTYDSASTMADPGTGKIRTDTASGTPSSQAVVGTITSRGVDASVTLNQLKTGDKIYFQKLDNANDWGTYSLASPPVNNTTWWLFNITPIEQHGTPIAKNQEVLVRFTYGTNGGGGGGGGGAGHVIQDEGSVLPSRASLDFVGPGVSIIDDSTLNKTVVQVPEQTIVSPTPPSTALPEGTWWVDEDSSASSPGVSIVSPDAPDPTGLPEGTMWVDEDSNVLVAGVSIVSPTPPNTAGLPEGTTWVDEDSIASVPGVAIVSVEPPDPTGLPNGMIWVDEDSDV